jgi:hypothetical protein
VAAVYRVTTQQWVYMPQYEDVPFNLEEYLINTE